MRNSHALATKASIALGLFLLPHFAHAEASSKDIADARELAEAGMQAQSAGKFADCATKFAAAHKLYPEATTVTLRLAECLKGAGRLVESREAYLELQRTPIAANAPAQFKSAQAQGKAEGDELEKLVPVLTITVDPSPPPSGTEFHMQRAAEGNAAPVVEVLDAAWIGTPRRVNPGTYTVFATAPGYASKTKQVVLAEGDKKSEALTLSAGEAAPVLSGATTKVAGPGQEPPPPYTPPEDAPPPAGKAPKNALLLGIGGGVLAVAGRSNSDILGDNGYSGGSGVAHVDVLARLGKFLVGGIAEYQPLPFTGDNGRKLQNGAYVGAHVGVITTAEKKVAFWLDGGLGAQFNEAGSTGVGGRVQLGPSFPLGKLMRLVTKGFLGFGTTPGAYVFAGLSADLVFEIPLSKTPQAQPVSK